MFVHSLFLRELRITFIFVSNIYFCLQEWYVALVKSQCSLPGDTSLLETTELLTKLPPADLHNVMSCKVTQPSAQISTLINQ